MVRGVPAAEDDVRSDSPTFGGTMDGSSRLTGVSAGVAVRSAGMESASPAAGVPSARMSMVASASRASDNVAAISRLRRSVPPGGKARISASSRSVSAAFSAARITPLARAAVCIRPPIMPAMVR